MVKKESANKTGNKTDWSKGRHIEALIHQRKFMWLEDTVPRIADWIQMKAPMTLADVGCGLGYVGYSYWPYFGKGGKYIGIDSNQKLLVQAREGSEWAEGGETEFLHGDAYALPLDSNSVDMAFCQTVLMHLDNPEKALSEMIRVVKPGGKVVCFEPDNLSATLLVQHMSIPEESLEEKLLMRKVCFHLYEGRLKLGKGDYAIGAKLPQMMARLGLKQVNIRNNDRVTLVVPPYENEEQKYRIEQMRRHLSREHEKEEMAEEKEEFLAGGGDMSEWAQYEVLVKKVRKACLLEIEAGTFHCCSPSLFFVIKGTKPAE